MHPRNEAVKWLKVRLQANFAASSGSTDAPHIPLAWLKKSSLLPSPKPRNGKKRMLSVEVVVFPKQYNQT